MPRRVVALLMVVVLSATAIAGYALYRGIDGVMVASYMAMLGVIFGASLGYQLRKRKGD